MTFIVANIRKNPLRIAVSPWSLAIWIGVPLLVGALLSGVMGGSGGATPKVHMLLADNDQSVLSGALSETLASDQFGEMLIQEPFSEEAGHAILDDGGASDMLIVPAEFQSNFLKPSPQELRLIVNPLQSIRPEMAEELTGMIAQFAHTRSRRLVANSRRSTRSRRIWKVTPLKPKGRKPPSPQSENSHALLQR